jgi:hypothetical protein
MEEEKEEKEKEREREIERIPGNIQGYLIFCMRIRQSQKIRRT